MFSNKKKQLFEKSPKNTSVKENINSFLNQGSAISNVTTSGNGAKKYSETIDSFVNQFGQIGAYKEPRSFKEISIDCAELWSIDNRLSVQFIVFLRLITRKVNIFNKTTEQVQKGAGLKFESINRMIWLQVNHPDAFWQNVHVFIAAGSWKDIFLMLSYDLQYHGWDNKILDWGKLGNLILSGLQNPEYSELIKKYLPSIRAKSKCNTIESQSNLIIGKWLCSLIFGPKYMKDNKEWSNYKQYRKLKSSGKAHEWQKLISQSKFYAIDFNTIHGKALSILVGSDFLKTHNLLDKYTNWLSTQQNAKYTGYVYELADKINKVSRPDQYLTIDKQFQELLNKGGSNKLNLIAVKDTSTSMNSIAVGTNMSSYDIAKSLSIYLGNTLTGSFYKYYIDFSSKAILRQIKGSTFSDAWRSETRTASANTNFLAVADLFIEIKNNGAVEQDFPEGIICLSDGEFDKQKMFNNTNIQEFRRRLIVSGFSPQFVRKFKFVFWDIRNNFYGSKKTKFETFFLEDNVFYFSGFDASVISFLEKGEVTQKEIKNAKDVFLNAMNQELINYVV